MNEPYWLTLKECQSLHDLMMSDYGGLPGIRDQGMLESALAKPKQLLAYGNPTLVDLAAAYTAGIVKNHPFLDGNKRTGFMMGAGFLERNGYIFTATEEDAVLRTLALAAGEMTESAFAAWLEANSHPA